jgi:hypothetical protein
MRSLVTEGVALRNGSLKGGRESDIQQVAVGDLAGVGMSWLEMTVLMLGWPLGVIGRA